jgi:hypothetical protein
MDALNIYHPCPFLAGSTDGPAPRRPLSGVERIQWHGAVAQLIGSDWLRGECRFVGKALSDSLHESGELIANAAELAEKATQAQAKDIREKRLASPGVEIAEPEPIPEWLARECLRQLESVGALRHQRRFRLVPWPGGGAKGRMRREQAASAYELLMPAPRGLKPRRRRRPAQEIQGPASAEAISSESESESDSFFLCPPGSQPPIVIWTMYLALCGQAIGQQAERIEILRRIDMALPPIAQEGRAGPH